MDQSNFNRVDTVLELIDGKFENETKLLCTDEDYTSFELLYECTERHIPFVGCINPRFITIPAVNKVSKKVEFKSYFEKSEENCWLWICWDHADQLPITLIRQGSNCSWEN